MAKRSSENSPKGAFNLRATHCFDLAAFTVAAQASPNNSASVDADHRASVFCLGNGFIGMRGAREEEVSGPSTYLNGVYETTPIHYHEAAHGFARHSDTRLAVACGLRVEILVGRGKSRERFSLEPEQSAHEHSWLDLEAGILHREIIWKTADFGRIFLRFERIVHLLHANLALMQIDIEPESQKVDLTIRSYLTGPDHAEPIAKPKHTKASGAKSGGEIVYDPRLSPALKDPAWKIGAWRAVKGAGAPSHALARVDQLAMSGFRVATAMSHASTGSAAHWSADTTHPINAMVECRASVDANSRFRLHKALAYASDAAPPSDTSSRARPKMDGDLAQANPKKSVEAAIAAFHRLGYDALRQTHQAAWEKIWAENAIRLPQQPELETALRYNLFQLRQSVQTGGLTSVAAKGQTGEGYEGHVFWDAEAFALPVLALTSPEHARSMLLFRARTLWRARENARKLGHKSGALFPWRTLGGEECSAYFPAGSAQYHINADIAYGIETYIAATGDNDFLAQYGLEMLIETARIWLQIGHFNPRMGGAFCIDKVTGPDEYSALVDNNYYTNAMAKRHLLFTLEALERVSAHDPKRAKALVKALEFSHHEAASFRQAADKMRLPFDETLQIIAQDDYFLERKVWDFAATRQEDYPLLLHFHPLTIYRYQVCKQADAVLALFLGRDAIAPDVVTRSFHYYEAVTTHDSTLSPSVFAIVAAQIGAWDKFLPYWRMTSFVDLDNLCANTDHGLHMAALAGSWQAMFFGLLGARMHEGGLAFAPHYLNDLGPYALRFHYCGRVIAVEVDAQTTQYRVVDGEGLTISHFGEACRIEKHDALSLPSHCVGAQRAALASAE